MNRPIQLFSLLLTASVSFAGNPKSFAYVLQADSKFKPKSKAIETLRDCGRDWIILDAAYDGEDRWASADLAKIRSGKPGRKTVAYVSIGEAEDYRAYWQRSWDRDEDGNPDKGAPAWLNIENPDWEGNYKVKYWLKGCQEIMLPEIERVMKQGFDGVYLDIVDAFEFYEVDGDDYLDNRPNPETGNSYRADMARWIATIAARARSVRRGAMIVPQNAAQLLVFKDYRGIVSGIGVEDLYTNGKKKQPRDEVNYTFGFLKKLKADGKPILVIDYSKKGSLVGGARRSSEQNGFVFLNTDRPLKTLGSSP